jgi:deoxyribose-phosphate aldolase
MGSGSSGNGIPRNAGEPLDLDRVLAIRVNRSAAERRAATIPTRRTVKKELQAAWLLRAVTLMDLTTLSGDDTPGNVRRLCAKARQPLRPDLVDALGVSHRALVAHIHRAAGAPVQPTDDLGLPIAAREAAEIAVLGALCADAVPITLPAVTGATGPASLSGSWISCTPQLPAR